MRSQRYISIGQQIRIPIESSAGSRWSYFANGLDRKFLQKAFPRWPRAQVGQDGSHDDFHSFLLGCHHCMCGKSSEVVQYVAGLCFIPPPERFNSHVELHQGCFGLLDLSLCPPMCKHEWKMMVENYFHRIPIGNER